MGESRRGAQATLDLRTPSGVEYDTLYALDGSTDRKGTRREIQARFGADGHALERYLPLQGGYGRDVFVFIKDGEDVAHQGIPDDEFRLDCLPQYMSAADARFTIQVKKGGPARGTYAQPIGSSLRDCPPDPAGARRTVLGFIEEMQHGEVRQACTRVTRLLWCDWALATLPRETRKLALIRAGVRAASPEYQGRNRVVVDPLPATFGAWYLEFEDGRWLIWSMPDLLTQRG